MQERLHGDLRDNVHELHKMTTHSSRPTEQRQILEAMHKTLTQMGNTISKGLLKTSTSTAKARKVHPRSLANLQPGAVKRPVKTSKKSSWETFQCRKDTWRETYVVKQLLWVIVPSQGLTPFGCCCCAFSHNNNRKNYHGFQWWFPLVTTATRFNARWEKMRDYRWTLHRLQTNCRQQFSSLHLCHRQLHLLQKNANMPFRPNARVPKTLHTKDCLCVVCIVLTSVEILFTS